MRAIMDKAKLNISEINDMKADYCLGNLSPEDTSLFEKSIVDFPDIHNEIQQIKVNLFKVDASNFNEYMERKARNVSVYVNERLSSKTIKINWFKKPYLIAASAMSITIILFLLIFNKNQNTIQDYTVNGTIEKTIMNIIEKNINNEQDLLSINNDYSFKNHLLGYEDNIYNDSGVLEDDILYDEIIDFTNISHKQLNYLLSDNSLSYVFKDIMNEEFINYFIEEIENETFN